LWRACCGLTIMPELKGKIVLITGAAAGIGLAAANLCESAGARLVLVDRDAEALAAAASAFGDTVVTLAADVADPDTASRYVDAAISRFGRIDIALLNAGMAGVVAPIHAVTADDFDRIMAVNVRSVWSGIAALFPVMKQDGGSIVVTASTGGVMGAPMVAPYIASKHAVIGLVKSAALEGARYGIRVNAVAPAPIDTAMMAHINDGLGGGDAAKSRARTIAHVPMQRYGAAEEVARTMIFLGSGDASYTTGAVYLVDGGMAAGLYP
jgi:NAD(P)-dependent dehydrogenase (short-subunit alcohol dehydrogenase family)